ncbi:MAG TPA: response regulator [Burkholderiaceae bacterium]|nr:response regulator [Burkholderiaceae bacterium]
MEEKPLFRVGAAGLDPRDSRLIEIVFKHSQYNKYEYQLTTSLEHGAVDILIVNSVEPEGLQALALIRSSGRTIPVIAAVPRGAPSSARHAISIDRLTLQLLPILNRVVELELLSPETRPMGLSPVPGQSFGTPSFAAPAPPFTAPATRMQAAGATAAAGMAGGSAGGSAGGAGSARAPSAPAVPAAAGATATSFHAPASAPTAAPVRPGSAPGADAGRPPGQGHPNLTAVPPAAAAAQGGVPSNLVAFPLNASDPPVGQRLRVLVVDDSPTVRRQLTMAFDRMGIACETAENGSDAIAKLWEQHFDLALVDVVMPDMDGYKLTREIKRNRHWRQLPVIILTSRSSPFDLARGALAGCNTYLTKPVPFRALEAAVIKQMRRYLAIDDITGMIRPATRPVAPSASASSPRGVMARLFRR